MSIQEFCYFRFSLFRLRRVVSALQGFAVCQPRYQFAETHPVFLGQSLSAALQRLRQDMRGLELTQPVFGILLAQK